MSHKTWLTKDGWVAYAACGGDSRFLTPPNKLSEADCEETQSICHKCPVRAECIQQCVGNGATGVWCASVWIPEVSIHMGKQEAYDTLAEAERVRAGLAGTVEDELKRRGEF